MKKLLSIYLFLLLLFFGSALLPQVITADESNLNVTFVNSDTFLSKWNTSLTSLGSSSPHQISLPLESSGTYNFSVNWGDGTNDIITNWDQPEVTHTYSSEGIYAIAITGTLIGWRFNNGGDKLKIIEISQWGNIRLGNSDGYFYGSSNLQLTAFDTLNLTGTTTLNQAFRDCSNLGTSGNMNTWDVSGITNMEDMFRNAGSFNQPISKWDVSSVSNMRFMFGFSPSFNQPITYWNTSSVTSMTSMFSAASSFNQPIGNWDVSKVINMGSMFDRASSFNQPIENWNVSSVENMGYLFKDASSFNQSLHDWDVSSVKNMGYMFSSASSFNQPINSWDVSNVTSMQYMFGGAYLFNQSLHDWDVSNVINMEGMFSGTFSFNQPLGNWNVSNVAYMENMFIGVTLSTANYDDLLTGWAALSLKKGIFFHGGNSQYSNITAKWYIVDTFEWLIIDRGAIKISFPSTASPEDMVGQTSTINPLDNGIKQTSVDRLNPQTSPNSGNYANMLIFILVIFVGLYYFMPKSRNSTLRRDLIHSTRSIENSNSFCRACDSTFSQSDIFCGECGIKI